MIEEPKWKRNWQEFHDIGRMVSNADFLVMVENLSPEARAECAQWSNWKYLTDLIADLTKLYELALDVDTIDFMMGLVKIANKVNMQSLAAEHMTRVARQQPKRDN